MTRKRHINTNETINYHHMTASTTHAHIHTYTHVATIAIIKTSSNRSKHLMRLLQTKCSFNNLIVLYKLGRIVTIHKVGRRKVFSSFTFQHLAVFNFFVYSCIRVHIRVVVLVCQYYSNTNPSSRVVHNVSIDSHPSTVGVICAKN